MSGDLPNRLVYRGGEVTNLSLWGCAIETPRCLIPGEYVRLHMLLPDQNLRIDVGKVRWVEPYRFGVEFLNVPNDQHLRITRTVKTCFMNDSEVRRSPMPDVLLPQARHASAPVLSVIGVPGRRQQQCPCYLSRFPPRHLRCHRLAPAKSAKAISDGRVPLCDFLSTVHPRRPFQRVRRSHLHNRAVCPRDPLTFSSCR